MAVVSMACCRPCGTRRVADAGGGSADLGTLETMEMRLRATAAFGLAMAAWLGACGAIAGERAAPMGGDGTAARPSRDGGSSTTAPHALRIAVDGIRSSSGTVLIGLYDSAESFERAIELSDK